MHKIHKAHKGADSSIIVDHYSDYIELDSLRGNTSANSVISAMKRQFARHGIPDELITAKGPQFKSNEYSRFAGEYGFTIVKSSPYYSRENGRAELAVKIAKKHFVEVSERGSLSCSLGVQKHPLSGLQLLPSTTSHVKRTTSAHPADSVPISSASRHRRKKTKINGSVEQEGFTAS